MSSHHIVREKQEPALLVLELADFPDELLGQLLEWSPVVICTATMAEKLNSYGTKVDYVIADKFNNDIQSDVKLIRLNGRPILDAAFAFLLSNGYSAVNLITGDFDPDGYVGYVDKINIVLFTAQQKIYPVHTGFSKWLPAGENISLVSPCNNLRFTGLEKVGESHFQTTADGFFTLYFDALYLFIAEHI